MQDHVSGQSPTELGHGKIGRGGAGVVRANGTWTEGQRLEATQHQCEVVGARFGAGRPEKCGGLAKRLRDGFGEVTSLKTVSRRRAVKRRCARGGQGL